MLKLSNVEFAYTKNNILYSNLNLEIKSGHVYGLLGCNGSGKSTLLQLFSGVVFATKGSVVFRGNSIAERNVQSLQEIFLLADESSEHSSLSGYAYLNVYKRFYPFFNIDTFYSIAKDFAVPLDVKLSSLSEGMYKKYKIAFALATNCKLILLDEPTNGLDIPSKVIFKRIIAKFTNLESTIIISSHQLHDIENIIDNIIIIDNGNILLNQSLEQIEKELLFINGMVEQDADILYSTSTVNGMSHIIRRNSNEQYASNVMLELLFQFVIEQREKVNKIFSVRKGE